MGRKKKKVRRRRRNKPSRGVLEDPKLNSPIITCGRLSVVNWHNILPDLLLVGGCYLNDSDTAPEILHAFMDKVDSLIDYTDKEYTGKDPSKENKEVVIKPPFIGDITTLLKLFPAAGDLIDQVGSHHVRRIFTGYNAALVRLGLIPSWNGLVIGLGLEKEHRDRDLDSVKKLIFNMYDGKGFLATWIRGMGLSRIIKNNFIFFRNREFLEKFSTYPHCEDLEIVESQIRSKFAVFAKAIEESGTRWRTAFWQKGFEISDCEPEEIPARTPGAQMQELVSLAENSTELLFEAAREIVFTAEDQVRGEVDSGLYCRVAKLQKKVVDAFKRGDQELEQILFRCMIESIVYFFYLNKSHDIRKYHGFVQHTLAEDKKLKYNIEKRIGDDEPIAIEKRMLGSIEKSIRTEDTDPELVEVRFDNWFGNKSFRDIVNELGIPGMYSFAYSTSSQFVHGLWGSIRSRHLKSCKNPLHNFHRITSIEEKPHGTQVVEGATLFALMLLIEIGKVYPNAYAKYKDEAEKLQSQIEIRIDALEERKRSRSK